MKERIVTAVIMMAVLATVIFFIPQLFVPMVAVILGISIWEWCRTCQLRRVNWYADASATIALWVIACIYPIAMMALLVLSVLHYLYALLLVIKYEKVPSYRIHRHYLRWCGPVILAALASSLVYVFHPDGQILGSDDAQSLVFMMMIVAGADTGAYFAGRAFGKHKLSPRVSPKKTIEGLIGGLLTVTAIVVIFDFLVAGWYLGFWQLWFISLIAALFSVVGDLFISVIKRQNGIKDTSQILPGHGGFLDRVDGLMAGIPVFYLMQQVI